MLVSKFCSVLMKDEKGEQTFLILIKVSLLEYVVSLLVLLVKRNNHIKLWKFATFTLTLKLKKLHSEIYCYQLVN